MYITVHQVQLPERGHRAAAPVQQTQYSSVHQYISTARALATPPGQGLGSNVRSPNPELREVLDQRGGGVRSV